MHTRKVIAGAMAAALLGAGCGKADKPSAPAGPQIFKQAGVPFTFRYPADFSAVEAPRLPKGFIAILGVDKINFIDVRITSHKELAARRIPEVVGKALRDSGLTIVSSTRSQLAGMPLFSYVVKSSVKSTPTTSRLSFFAAMGRTWEVGCQYTRAAEGKIGAACSDALASLALQG